MNISNALALLCLENQEFTRETLVDAYNRKRAETVSENFSEEEMTHELEKLNQAKETILLNLAEQKNSRGLTSSTHSQAINVLNVNPFLSGSEENEDTDSEENICPNCRFLNEADDQICVNCQTQMFRPCPNCGTRVRIDQKKCTKCHTLIKEYDLKKFSYAFEVEQKTQFDREVTKVEASKAEDKNRRFIQFGMIHWLIILMVIAGLCVLVFQFTNNPKFY